MEKCIRCGVKENQVKLFDAIYSGKVEYICERCSIIENVPIIVKPNVSQIKESKKGVKVYERMKRLAGMEDHKKTKTIILKERLEQLEKNPQLEVPEKNKIELIDHFHWEVMKCRRRKGLSQKQLAELIGEPEFTIAMIEKGNLDLNAEILVKKLEQFFNIRLRKLSSLELMGKRGKKEPVLLDENGNILERIPEPELIIEDESLEIESETDEEEGKGKRFFNNLLEKFKKKENNSEIEEDLEEDFEDEDLEENLDDEDFDLDKIDTTQVKIGDLKRWHRKKIEATKEEKTEEQKKIEERQRLIEARKEELRLIKERESRDLDSVLGGTELLTPKKDMKRLSGNIL